MPENLSAAIEQLRSADAAARSRAAQQIAERGEEGAAAAVTLVEACRDEDEGVHEWVVAALEGLGPPPAAEAARLARLVADPKEEVAYWAATLLGRLAGDAAGAAAAIAKAIVEHPSPVVRRRMAWALEQIGVGTPAVLEALSKVEQDAAARAEKALAREAAKARESLAK